MKTKPTISAESRLAPLNSCFRPASLLKYWFPLFLWMLVIFAFSSDVGSSRHTSRIIGPILRWLNPKVSDAAIEHVQLAVRKASHVTEYAVLTLLTWRAVRQPQRSDPRLWSRRAAAVAFAVAALFAASDEWHQSFIPTRQAQAVDVLIDSTGAALGLGGLWAWGRWRQRW